MDSVVQKFYIINTPKKIGAAALCTLLSVNQSSKFYFGAFDRMVEFFRVAEKIKKAKCGKPSNLTTEDRMLMTLEYLREYRTNENLSSILTPFYV
jgi:hypothetical protein